MANPKKRQRPNQLKKLSDGQGARKKKPHRSGSGRHMRSFGKDGKNA